MVVSEIVMRALKLLGDQNFIIEHMPGVVGIKEGRVRIMFRRWFFRFADDYTITAAFDDRVRASEVLFNGKKSVIRMVFRPTPLGIDSDVEYRGPRKRIVAPKARSAAETLARVALAKAREAESRVGRQYAKGISAEDYSGLLSDIGWLTDLIMKSTLIDNIIIESGPDLEKTLAEIAMKKQGEYEAIYASARKEGAELRALFRGGTLIGAYARISGEEILGREAFSRVSGMLAVRVYGVISLPKSGGSKPSFGGVSSHAEAGA